MKIPHLRWWIAGLLFTATAINYIDRQALSVVAPSLTKELHLTPVQYAGILQGFLYAYTIMYLVSGILVDRWGTRAALAVFMVWWSSASILHAWARTAGQLIFVRVLLGIGEPGNFMAGNRVVSEWYPPQERAFVNGLGQSGAAVGAVVAAPLVVWLSGWLGWRSMFAVTGCLGFVWLGAWLLVYRVPGRHPWITAGELLLVQERDAAKRPPATGARWIELWRLPQTWGLFGARFVADPVWWFYLFWLPKYLVEQHGLSMLQMGMLAWLPYLTADIGSIAGGLLSGILVKRGRQVLEARSAVMLPFALLMPLNILLAFHPPVAIAIAIICIVTFSHMAWRTNLGTVTNDLYPTGMVGSISGMVAFATGLSGALFTNLTGHMVQRFSYDIIFIVMGFMHPAAYLVFKLLVRGPVDKLVRGPEPSFNGAAV